TAVMLDTNSNSVAGAFIKVNLSSSTANVVENAATLISGDDGLVTFGVTDSEGEVVTTEVTFTSYLSGGSFAQTDISFLMMCNDSVYITGFKYTCPPSVALAVALNIPYSEQIVEGVPFALLNYKNGIAYCNKIGGYLIYANDIKSIVSGLNARPPIVGQSEDKWNGGWPTTAINGVWTINSPYITRTPSANNPSMYAQGNITTGGIYLPDGGLSPVNSAFFISCKVPN
ncbi:hypothetical protein, partial [Shewanella sp.]|uniref:hypothetical protein n=1 Tax=Shewanella sp. TaxID=50422 RepID=UPI002585E7DB